ncbi:hypothetical protein EON64_12400 [archaeon]|nr:MAG: hypothetical protein EON64_12400 [archaeon]
MIRALQTRRIQLLGHDSTKCTTHTHNADNASTSATSATAASEGDGHGYGYGYVHTGHAGQTRKEFELSRYRHLERCIRTLPIATIAPLDAFTLSDYNRYVRMDILCVHMCVCV